MGINTARARRGIREKSGEKTDKFKKGHKSDSTKVTLGKRTKTATDYGKKNTSTFKT